MTSSHESLGTTATVQRLLDLEDEAPDALFEPLPGSPDPFWPSARSYLAYEMMSAELASVAVASPTPSRASLLARAVQSQLPGRWDVRGLAQSDLCFITSGITVAASEGLEHNWLVGDYAQLAPDESTILQWAPLPGRHGPPAHPRTRSLDRLVTRAAIDARLRPLPGAARQAAGRLVTEFVRRLPGALDGQAERIAQATSYGEGIVRRVNRRLAAVLDRVQPRIVLIDNPVDGSWGTTVAMMKRRGIHVAEPQHGWIGPSHVAYNFGAAAARSEFARMLPDELLTFGEHWSEGIRFPVVRTAIGKPQLERVRSRAVPWSDRDAEVLVVSSVGEPEQAARFVLELRARMPDEWGVRFRPHPSELQDVAGRYPALIGRRGITIDDRSDVHESLLATRIVIGVASTVLFEAAALGCCVFVRDSPYVPYITGDLFGEPLVGDRGYDRVLAAARGGIEERPGPDPDVLWATDPIRRFAEWKQSRLSPRG